MSAAKIEGLYQDIMDESGTEELLKDGLVMHSTFDEGSVTKGQITDVTGNGNNGTVVGAPAYEKGIRGKDVYKRQLMRTISMGRFPVPGI